jgi:hypothetical protein
MSRVPAWVCVIFIVVACVCGIRLIDDGLTGLHAREVASAGLSSSQVSVDAWHRTEVDTPPQNIPITGVWTSNGLDVEFVIGFNGAWYEYAPTLKPPIGGRLYELPPVWWTPMPGAAK